MGPTFKPSRPWAGICIARFLLLVAATCFLVTHAAQPVSAVLNAETINICTDRDGYACTATPSPAGNRVDGDVPRTASEKQNVRKVSYAPPNFLCARYCLNHDYVAHQAAHYDFTECKCENARKAASTQRVRTPLKESDLHYLDKEIGVVSDLLGRPQGFTARVYDAVELYPKVIPFLGDCGVLFIGMNFGPGAGFLSSLPVSIYTYFYSSSFMSFAIEAVVRSSIGMVAPGVRDFNYLAVVAVVIMVTTVILGVTSTPMVAVTLLGFGVFAAYATIVMITQSGKFKTSVVSSVVLLSMQYVSTCSGIFSMHISSQRSILNIVIIVLRAATNGSGIPTDYTVSASFLDGVDVFLFGPLDLLGSREDLIVNFRIWVVVFYILRVISIVLFRLMLSTLPFTGRFTQRANQDITAWIQRLSLTTLYFPFRGVDSEHSYIGAVVNMIFYVWTFRSGIDVFLLLFLLAFPAYFMVGEFVIDIDKLISKRGNKDKKVIKHGLAYSVGEADDHVKMDYAQDWDIMDDVVERHAAFLKDNATLGTDVLKMFHVCEKAIKTNLGRGRCVVVGNNTIATVKHLFCGVHEDLPKDPEAYRVHIDGHEYIPSVVLAGPKDREGEQILKLVFAARPWKGPFPIFGSNNFADSAMHVLPMEGSLSFVKSLRDVENRPNLVGYSHDCGKSDSGRGGYTLDGEVVLTTLHVGSLNGQSVGMKVESDVNFSEVLSIREPIYASFDDEKYADDDVVGVSDAVEPHINRRVFTNIDVKGLGRLRASAKKTMAKFLRQCEQAKVDTSAIRVPLERIKEQLA